MAVMDFNTAVSVHLQWKMRLAALIEATEATGLDPVLLSRDDDCDLGRWIHGDGPRQCGAHAEFAALRDAHSRFHRVAAEVARRALAGEREAALALMEGDYFAISSSVVLAIVKLRRACGG